MRRRIGPIIITTIAAVGLAACGGESGSSSGGGGGTVTPPPPATPPPPPPPTSGAAANCPTGLLNAGTITTGAGQVLRNCVLPGTITGSLTLTDRAGTIYSLGGPVEVGVDGGATGTLVLEAGVTIFGSTPGDILLVNRGSRINATGSASSPIILTSEANVRGTALTTTTGSWGGLVILGEAPISGCNSGSPSNPGGTRADCEATMPGTTAEFGGANPGDTSGTLRFVQIRFPRFVKFGGTGTGTTIENVQVHNSAEDGIEWRGGTANGKNLLVTGATDNGISVGSGYRGTLQFVLVLAASNRGESGFLGGNGGSATLLPRTNVRISNATFVGANPPGEHGLEMTEGGDFAFYNSVVTGFGACLDIDDSETLDPADGPSEEAGPPTFDSIFLSCGTPYANDGDVAVNSIAALFNAGSNNTEGGTSTLSARTWPLPFVNGNNENAVAFTAVTAVSSFFENVTYIGAVQNANDARFSGWTCDLEITVETCLELL